MSTTENAASAIRRGNARDCLRVLRDAAGPLSVGDLAASTGLSRPTVEAVLQDLTAAGTVSPAPSALSGTAGRPARRFALDPAVATVAALDVGARSVRCLVADAGGRVLTRTSVPIAADDPLSSLERAVQESGSSPRALGVAVPGILDADGRVVQSLAAPALVGLDLAGELERRLGCPVVIENDIKLAALAERHLGQDADSIVFLQLGHRVSVAVIVGGTILQGAHRLAGELGSQRGMRWTRTSVRGRLSWSTGDDAQPLLERAADGDAAAQQEIEEFCAEIAPRLATVLLTVDPELVVVGGGLSRAGETLLDPLRRALRRLLMTEHAPAVVPARLSSGGALIGALGLAFERGSGQIVGVPDVPAPWHRFPTTTPSTPSAKDTP